MQVGAKHEQKRRQGVCSTLSFHFASYPCWLGSVSSTLLYILLSPVVGSPSLSFTSACFSVSAQQTKKHWKCDTLSFVQKGTDACIFFLLEIDFGAFFKPDPCVAAPVTIKFQHFLPFQEFRRRQCLGENEIGRGGLFSKGGRRWVKACAYARFSSSHPPHSHPPLP